MSPRLQKIPFTEELLGNKQVQEFECGAEEWDREVAAELKKPLGTDGLLDIAAQEGMGVWLYIESNGDLVGFGSVGPGRGLKWPKKNPDQVPSSVIPWLAVSRPFQGNGYGKEILRDLIDVAKVSAVARRIVVLSVHERNPAIRLYTNHNFAVFGGPRSLVDGGPKYLRLVLDLWPNGVVPQ